MEYPQIVHLYVPNEIDAHVIGSPYPGESDVLGTMSLAYYRHHKGWTRSQAFIDYVQIHGVPAEHVTAIMLLHDQWLDTISRVNKFGSLTRFRDWAFRLLEAHAMRE